MRVRVIVLGIFDGVFAIIFLSFASSNAMRDQKNVYTLRTYNVPSHIENVIHQTPSNMLVFGFFLRSS